MCFISQFGRFHEDFPLKEGTERVPLPFSRNWHENHSHNQHKAKGWIYSARLSPLYPFHISLSLSLISPTLSISLLLSFFLSHSLCLLSIILFGVSNGRFRPCFINHYYFWEKKNLQNLEGNGLRTAHIMWGNH